MLRSYTYLVLFILLGQTVFSSQPLSLRNSWIGRYDIRMVGSVALQPAFVSSTNPVQVTGFLTDDIMRRTGAVFTTNNRYPTKSLLADNVKNGCSVFDFCSDYFDGRCDSIESELRYKTTEVNTALVYADCDEDTTTFQSSWAYLDFSKSDECVKIQSAYLYWMGGISDYTTVYDVYPGSNTMKSYNGGSVGNAFDDFNLVLFKTPDIDEYREVQADFVYEGDYSPSYICVADVTEYLNLFSVGKYWVANIQSSSTKLIMSAGWCLVVVYSSNSKVRDIVLYDGFETISSSGLQSSILLDDLKVPSTEISASYLGVGVLDGENTAPEIISIDYDTLKTFRNKVTNLDGQTFTFSSKCDFETLDFYTETDSVYINPIVTNNDWYYFANEYGVPYGSPFFNTSDICDLDSFPKERLIKGYDGFLSSRITTYDNLLNKNGAPVLRMPSLENTLGLDLHHLKLPKGAISPGSNTARMVINSGKQGGVFPFLAYIAIERAAPKLEMTINSEQSYINLDNNEITYQLKVFNVGDIVQEENKAFIIDSLDDAVVDITDFNVPSSIYGKNAILLGGVQENEETGKKFIKIQIVDSLPGLDEQSNSVLAEDTLVVNYTAVIAGENYPDWKLKCRRYIENQAWVYYGDSLMSGANLDECGVEQQSDPVSVTSELFQEYDELDSMSVDLSEKLILNPNLPVLSTLQSVLYDSITARGVSDFNVDLYDFTNKSGVAVSETDVFDITSSPQHFMASYTDSSGNCSETYMIDVVLLDQTLQVNIVSQSPKCYGTNDGSIKVEIQGGVDDSIYTVSLCKGKYSEVSELDNLNSNDIVEQEKYVANSSLYTSVVDIDTLEVGNYTLFVVPENLSLDSELDTITLTENTEFSLSISATNTFVCDGSNANAYAAINGVPPAGSKEYMWERSIDNVAWEPVDEVTTRALVYLINGDESFRVRLKVGDCLSSYSNIVSFTSLTTPIAYLPSVDSACYEYDLHNLPLTEESGASDYEISLHRVKPKTALDNVDIIKEENYKIVLPQRIYARMSVNQQCYTVDSIDIEIKAMDECYPIVVPGFFSPDGDGINDLFLIPGLEEYNNPEVIVFNKQGIIVFRGGKEDLTEPNGWDGTYLGKKLPSADYWYQIKFLEIKPKIGHFSLKRGRGE